MAPSARGASCPRSIARSSLKLSQRARISREGLADVNWVSKVMKRMANECNRPDLTDAKREEFASGLLKLAVGLIEDPERLLTLVRAVRTWHPLPAKRRRRRTGVV